MPILYTHKDPIIGIWKINERWQDMLARLDDKDIYMSALNRMKSESHKKEWLAVRLLLKHLLGAETNVSYNDNGAPFLVDVPFRISISHTKGFAAVILDNSSSTGIDIEYRSDRAWRLRERYMGSDELQIIENSHEPVGVSTICWCAKETAFKVIGEDNFDFIEHLKIYPFSYSEKGSLRIKEKRTDLERILNIDYQVTDDYIITWIN